MLQCSHDIGLEQRSKENGRYHDDEPELKGRWRQRVRHGESINCEHQNSSCEITGFIRLKTHDVAAADKARCRKSEASFSIPFSGSKPAVTPSPSFTRGAAAALRLAKRVGHVSMVEYVRCSGL